MDGSCHPAFAPSRQNGPPLESESADVGSTHHVASTLSERIELLDGDTRSCWRRVDVLEDEEASVNRRLVGLERLRRGERMEILSLEQACKAAEMAMLKAQEDTADLDAKSQALEAIAQDASEDAAAVLEAEQFSLSDRHGGSSSPRRKGSAALVVVLGKIPAHEEKRRHMLSQLQEYENEIRREIAEAARSAAELRRSVKKRGAESLPLERETSTLREELAGVIPENEINPRMVRARQVGEGLQRRLQHANEKFAQVRDAFTQGSAKDLEDEEQRSLELMQGITEAKESLRFRTSADVRPGPTTRTNREGRPVTVSLPKLEMQPSHSRSRKGPRHGQTSGTSGNHNTWGGWG